MRIEKLDGLRGVFSLMVVFYHYPAYFDVYRITSNFLVDWSELFVDFFFVLSGFVIALNYAHRITGAASLRSFLAKRFIRISPLLLFTVFLYFILEFVSNTFFSHFLDTTMSYQEITIRTLDSMLFLNSTPLIGTTLGMNAPTWSISAEMIAYLVFGFGVFVARGKSGQLFALIVAGIIAFFIYKKGYLFTGDYGFLRGLLGFLTGYLVFRLKDVPLRFSNHAEWILVPALLVVFYTLEQLRDNPMVEMYALGIVPLFFGGSIFLLLHTEGIISNLMKRPFFTFLGKISYSIYLTHALFVYAVPKFFFDVVKIPQTEITLLLVMIVTVGGVIVFSTWTQKYVEMETGNLLKKKFLQRRDSKQVESGSLQDVGSSA